MESSSGKTGETDGPADYLGSLADRQMPVRIAGRAF